MTVYADVVAPPLVFRDRVFTEPLTVVGRGVVGRVLFTTHDVVIEHCTFIREDGSAAPPMLLLSSVYAATVRCCWFGPREGLR